MVVVMMVLLLLVVPVRMLRLLRRSSRPRLGAAAAARLLATMKLLMLLLERLWQPGWRGQGRGDSTDRGRADHAARSAVVATATATASVWVMPARCRAFVALLHVIRLVGATVFGWLPDRRGCRRRRRRRCLFRCRLPFLLAKVYLVHVLALDVIVVVHRRIVGPRGQGFPGLRTDGGIG